jgi:hypothetical protein
MKRATTALDALQQHDGQKVRAYGKNFKSLVGAGSWEISGFHYGHSRCACCGRPISRVLHLKNQAHDAISKADPNYLFTEEVDIGIVCGPRVFIESCAGFYDDPNREWERQWRVWKGYVDYVILCVQNKDLWDALPTDLRTPVDQYLEEGYKSADHSGPWWILRDAKRRYLRTKRAKTGELPDLRALYYNARGVVYGAKRLQLIPLQWELTNELKLNTHEEVGGTTQSEGV